MVLLHFQKKHQNIHGNDLLKFLFIMLIKIYLKLFQKNMVAKLKLERLLMRTIIYHMNLE